MNLKSSIPGRWSGARSRVWRAYNSVDPVVRLLMGAYMALAIYNLWRTATYLPSHLYYHVQDTPTYIQDADEALWSLDLWGGAYPFGFPLTVRVLGDGWRLHLAHVIGSAVGWSWLAYEVSRCVRNRAVRVTAVIWLLSTSLVLEVAARHQLVMTDSLSTTLFVILVALAVRWRRIGNDLLLWSALPIVILWIGYRKSNVVLLGAFIALMAVMAFRQRSRRFLGVTLVAASLVIPLNWTGSRTHQSGQTLTKWVRTVGIPTPEIRAFLIDRGMPDSQAVLDLGGRTDELQRLAYDPELADFRVWLRDDLTGAYAAWLLEHPDQLAMEAARSLSSTFTDRNPEAAYKNEFGFSMLVPGSVGRPRFPAGVQLGELAWVRPHPWLLLWVVATIVGSTVAGRRRADSVRDPLWQVGWFLFVLAPVHGMVTYFGDMSGPERHGIGAAVQLRIALIMLGAFAADSLMRIYRQERGRSSSAVSPNNAQPSAETDAATDRLTAPDVLAAAITPTAAGAAVATSHEAFTRSLRRSQSWCRSLSIGRRCKVCPTPPRTWR